MDHAPIAIFGYRRPEHLARTIKSLQQCLQFKTSPVFVFIDGPKNKDEENLILEVRNVAQKLLGEKATFIFSEQNKGLAQSIMDGLEQVFKQYEKAIIVEDDLLLSPMFLSFMNAALEKYNEIPEIFGISGYMFNLPKRLDGNNVIFLPFINSWGWATWASRWSAFDPLASGWEVVKKDRAVRRAFDVRGAYQYTKMLERQMTGKIDSWAIRWYWSVFKQQGLFVFPPQTYVSNIGFDGSGTHGLGNLSQFDLDISENGTMPDLCAPHRLSEPDMNIIRKTLFRQSGGWPKRIFSMLRFK